MIECRGHKGSWGFMGFPIDIWSHPIGSRVWLTPLPIPFETMSPSLTLQCIDSCGILLNCIFTWWLKIQCFWFSTITIGINLDHLYKKNQINGRALALSSSPWFLYNIYIMHNFNTMGSKPGCYIEASSLNHLHSLYSRVSGKRCWVR